MAAATNCFFSLSLSFLCQAAMLSCRAIRPLLGFIGLALSRPAVQREMHHLADENSFVHRP